MGDTIIGVQFGIANPAEIVKRSVVEVITDKTHSGNQPVPNGVFDARFGVIENGKVCPTCKQTNLLCPGHFGHITLARPVYLYQFLDHIQKILQIICMNCSNPYLADEQLEEIEKTFKGIDRFDEVREQTKDYKGTKDVRTNPMCRTCNTPMIKKVDRQELSVATAPLQLEAKMMVPEKKPESNEDEQVESTLLQPEKILRCFQRITDRHVELIGLNPKFSRPDWMICTVLAVPPLSVRPTVMDDNQRMEDDLTHKLIDIVRDNQRLRDRIDKNDSRDNIDKWTGLLQHHVATYVDNDIKGLPPAHQRSGRPLKTLKSRLGAKTGRVRGNLMGKRVDFSARSVITPDPNIELDELGVPEEIAMNLTFPEIVTQYNRDRLMMCVRNGPNKHPGAKSVALRGEARPLNLKFANPDLINLKEGDVVHRHLIDGDVVLFNRQPSLHKASMECHRIKVLPYSTFRLNVSATKPYNADFDGDEMNMHVPQSITAATELKYLASVLRQIISPRKNSPIIEIVQDTMTGAYRISNSQFVIPEHVAMNILARTKRPLSTLKRRNQNYTAPELISNVFPLIDHEGAGIKIKDGQLVSGRLKKGAFSSASEGLIHYIYNEFGPQRCGQFINDVQSVVTKFNLYQGFSVGTSDLIADEKTIGFVKEAIQKGKKNIADILSSVHEGTFYNDTGGSRPDGEELENRITKELKEVSKDVSEVAMKSLSSDNRMKQMVESGAKGDIWNICQMIAILPQQLVSGRRIQYTLQDRTLPHFAKYDHGMESHGFVENSFISGLRPAEFFFHAMGGREGLIDTAVKTSDSGYIQRKLVKNMEDLHVEYDGSVRNSNGSIIQFNYGGDGIDSICVEQQPCELGVMSMEDVYRNYGLSKDDVAEVVNGEIKEPIDDMVEQILLDRDMLVKDVLRFVKDDKLLAPVHLKRITEKFKNTYATKTDLTPDYVVDELNKLCNKKIIKHNKVFQILLRYYLAPKKSIMVLRYTKEIFDEVLREIQFKYIKARVHPGEMVGALAAQSIGEPTTQLTLNTFHSAGTVKANATAGVPRIGELLSATHNPKQPLNFIYLSKDKFKSEDDATRILKEIQNTTLRDITKSVRIYYDPDPSSTAVKDDSEMLKSYQRWATTQGQACTSPWIIRLELDPFKVAALPKTIDMAMIASKIQNNKSLKVFDCIPNNTNTSGNKLVLRINFTPEIVKNALALRFIEDKLLDTMLAGVDGIGRVYRRELNRELYYDEMVGGYAPVKQFVLDGEGTNLLDIALNPNTDPYRSFSNDVHEVLDIFGIETARICLYEEFSEVFESSGINYHHMIMLIDSMTAPGYILSTDRTGVNKNDEMGVLAKSSFEETAKHLFNAAVSAEYDNMRGVSANIMFGQKPPCGTGFVDILVDETQLPEGAEEEDDITESELEATNKKVEQKAEEAAHNNLQLEDLSFW